MTREEFLSQHLICPECRRSLIQQKDSLLCSGCGALYPIDNGVPILISPLNPVFNQEDFIVPTDHFFKLSEGRGRRLLKKIQPSITLNTVSARNYELIAERLDSKVPQRILVIGGSVDGEGIGALKSRPGNTWIESDVSHGPNTNIIFDSHQIPFAAESFDLVIIQAVLEHVLDPQTCVSEATRVLKNGGMIYAETPFMQQVHGGKYDFQRFTHLGHRRLFRHFVELGSGVVAGPGSALAWSIRYFFTSFAGSKRTDRVISYLVNFGVFWVKYFDFILNRSKGSIDAASGYFFWGQKVEGYLLSDRELLESYKGFRY